MRPVLKGRPLLFSVVATSFASSSLFYTEHRSRQYSNTLNSVLEYYGFKTEEQKQALRYLMQQSGIKDTDKLFDQKANNLKEIGELILEMVRQTQDHFRGRSENQERWDVQTADWMQDAKHQASALTALNTLDMINEIPSLSADTDIVCILGATNAIMKMRLAYAGALVNQNKLKTKRLVMLAGERYLTPDKKGNYVDGPEQELTQLAHVMSKQVDSLTETDLMRKAYETSTLYPRFLERAVLIDTPRRHLQRPTTETTVEALCEWLKKHPHLRSITFISNQPYIIYQKEVIKQVFKTQNLSNISIEIIGPKFNAEMERVSNAADIINCILPELGSRIWAATLNVLWNLKIEMSDPNLQVQYQEIYNKFPLVYNNIEQSLLHSMNGCK